MTARHALRFALNLLLALTLAAGPALAGPSVAMHADAAAQVADAADPPCHGAPPPADVADTPCHGAPVQADDACAGGCCADGACDPGACRTAPVLMLAMVLPLTPMPAAALVFPALPTPVAAAPPGATLRPPIA
jgi:hypothetical protein